MPELSLPNASDGVTIVIPHFGDPALALRLIESLNLADSERAVQVIVSDDASPIPFPETSGISIIRSSKNSGFGAAVNLGASLANHPWLVILNSDLVAKPGFLENLISNASPFQPALCGISQYVPKLGTWPPSAMRYPTALSTALLHSTSLRPLLRTGLGKRLARLARPTDQQTGRVDWVGGAVMIVPTDLFCLIGGFDERYFLYLEEVDFQRRLQAKGVPSVLLKEVEIVHEAGMSSHGISREFQEWRSRFLYERLWRGAPGETLLWTLMVGVVGLDALVEFVKVRILQTPDAPSRWRHRLRVLSEARDAARQAWSQPKQRGGGYATA